MFLESLLVLLLLFGALLVVYKGAVHEYQILQKDWSPNIEWSPLLGEQLPVVIRNVPQEWRGNWTRRATEHKSWPVYIETEDEIRKISWKEWLKTPGTDREFPTNSTELATIAKIPTQEWLDGGFRRWSWIPKCTTKVFVFTNTPLPLTKTTSIATLLQATDGDPLTVWLAHEGAIPTDIQEDVLNRDPWTLNADEVPLFEEVKFIEVKLRPGNALVIPTHWYFSIKSTGSEGSEGWGWMATFQTPISWVVGRIRGSGQK